MDAINLGITGVDPGYQFLVDMSEAGVTRCRCRVGLVMCLSATGVWSVV